MCQTNSPTLYISVCNMVGETNAEMLLSSQMNFPHTEVINFVLGFNGEVVISMKFDPPPPLLH